MKKFTGGILVGLGSVIVLASISATPSAESLTLITQEFIWQVAIALVGLLVVLVGALFLTKPNKKNQTHWEEVR